MNAFTVLLPYVESEKLATYFKGVKEALNDQTEYIRCDALQILSILIPNLTSEQKEMLIDPITSENVTVRKVSHTDSFF